MQIAFGKCRSSLLAFCLMPYAIVGSAQVDPMDLVKQTLTSPTVPYSGQLIIESHGAEGAFHKDVRVAQDATGRFRHEILDASGEIARSIISDGTLEWIYDRRLGKAWRAQVQRPHQGVRGVREEVALLAKNYRCHLVGSDQLLDHPVWQVELFSLMTGRLVRRMWIDRKYGVVMKMERYGDDGELAYKMEFKEIHLPDMVNPEEFMFEPPDGVKRLAARFSPGSVDLSAVKTGIGLDPQVPTWTPSGYVFESAGVIPYHGLSIAHYRYSDGVDVMSLFQMAAKNRFYHASPPIGRPMIGKKRARLFLDADHKLLEWRQGENRFVIVGQLPLSIMRQIAESVP